MVLLCLRSRQRVHAPDMPSSLRQAGPGSPLESSDTLSLDMRRRCAGSTPAPSAIANIDEEAARVAPLDEKDVASSSS